LGAKVRLHYSDDVSEQQVSGVMTIGVVGRLEAVDIHVGGDQPPAASFRPVDLAPNISQSRSAPPRAGHGVDLIRLALCGRVSAILSGKPAVPSRSLAVAGGSVAVFAGISAVHRRSCAIRRRALAVTRRSPPRSPHRLSPLGPIERRQPSNLRIAPFVLEIASLRRPVAQPRRQITLMSNHVPCAGRIVPVS
jgi:hypothetical protein